MQAKKISIVMSLSEYVNPAIVISLHIGTLLIMVEKQQVVIGFNVISDKQRCHQYSILFQHTY